MRICVITFRGQGRVALCSRKAVSRIDESITFSHDCGSREGTIKTNSLFENARIIENRMDDCRL
jgi:hypothetical protein